MGLYRDVETYYGMVLSVRLSVLPVWPISRELKTKSGEIFCNSRARVTKAPFWHKGQRSRPLRPVAISNQRRLGGDYVNNQSIIDHILFTRTKTWYTCKCKCKYGRLPEKLYSSASWSPIAI